MGGRTRWPARLVVHSLRLLDEGLTAAAVHEATGVPIQTLRTWRGGRIPRCAQRELDGTGNCEICGGPDHRWTSLDAPTYAYLLGVYLGDGLVKRSSGTFTLRVFCDPKYPEIVDAIAQAVTSIRGRPPHVAHAKDGRNLVTITSYWNQWQCLFPQHGKGRKHSRPIELTAWQQALADEAPGALARGLIHTDGWRGTNKVRVKGRDYEYPRYQFSNRSSDIRRIFTDACDRLGVAWRPWGKWHISIARREAVALLDEYVGVKT